MKTRFQLKPLEYLGAPETKQHLNRSIFSEIAPKYDFITKALSFGRDRTWKKHLIKSLPEIKHPSCLDLACGTGDITRMLGKHFPNGCITGLDLTPAMLDLAKQGSAYSHISYIEGSMAQLPIENISIDIVTGGYALRNAPDLDQTLNEVMRVLRPGGYAAFLDFSKPDNRIGQHISHFLLKFWGGFWGWLLHGNPDVYGYIADSLKLYPGRSALQQKFSEHGFSHCSSRRFFGGLLHMVLLQKQDPENDLE
jgi:demethylmenaquinone methyltransferase/2-methoxy-6-polyprenyl-1,4-benzoquinol methylase